MSLADELRWVYILRQLAIMQLEAARAKQQGR